MLLACVAFRQQFLGGIRRVGSRRSDGSAGHLCNNPGRNLELAGPTDRIGRCDSASRWRARQKKAAANAAAFHDPGNLAGPRAGRDDCALVRIVVAAGAGRGALLRRHWRQRLRIKSDDERGLGGRSAAFGSWRLRRGLLRRLLRRGLLGRLSSPAFLAAFFAAFLAVFFAAFFADFFADFFFAVTAFFLAFLPFAFFAFLL